MSKAVFDIVMISTGQSAELLEKLIHSIEVSHQGVKVCLVVVNQGPEKSFDREGPFDIQTKNVNKPLSLSAARNIGLQFVREKGIHGNHFMFPDDDTTFGPTFFEAYQKYTQKGKAYLGRVCAEENGADYKSYPKVEKLSGTVKLLAYVASVTLIIPEEIVEKAGLFDENLGAGAQWASSEDLDYYLRCCTYDNFTYMRALVNFHPSRFGKYENLSLEQIKKRFKGYTDGYLFVMYRYGLSKRAKTLPWRAVAGAAVSMLKGSFRLVPVYLWLASYRFKMKRYFERQKARNPQFFALL